MRNTKTPKAEKAETIKPLKEEAVLLTFGSMWKQKFKSDAALRNALAKNGADEIGAYYGYAVHEEHRRILDLSMSNLDALQNIMGKGVNVHHLYEKALVAFELNKAGPDALAELRANFKGSTVKSWLTQASLPSEHTLGRLHDEFDINAVAHSVLRNQLVPTNKGVEAAKTKAAGPAPKEKVTAEKIKPKKTAKPKDVVYTLENVWSEHHPTIEKYCEVTFNSQEADIYKGFVAEYPGAIFHFTMEMIYAMTDKHPRQDIEQMYASEIFHANYEKLDALKQLQVHGEVPASLIKLWLAPNGAPDDEWAEELEEKGIYLLHGSVLPEHFHNQKPNAEKQKKSAAPAEVEVDELLEHFSQHDIDGVSMLAEDFSNISDQGSASPDYIEAIKGRGFRALMEFCPRSLHHKFTSNNTFVVQCALFRIQIECHIGRVTVIRDGVHGGYSMFTRCSSLVEGMEKAFAYFDVIDSVLLEHVLRNEMGFIEFFVAGVPFTVNDRRYVKPEAFYDVNATGHDIEIDGASRSFSAQEFVLSAAETFRGAHVQHRDDSSDDRVRAVDVYDVYGTGAELRVMVIDPVVNDNGALRAAGRRSERENLTPENYVEMREQGITFEGNRMLFPLSDRARDAFHKDNPYVTHYIECVTFV